MELDYSLRDILIIFAGYIVLSASLAKLFIVAQDAYLFKSSFYACTSWISYLAVHKTEAGVYIDSPVQEKVMPHEGRNWLYLLISGVLFTVGMVLGAKGVSNKVYPQALLGAVIIIAGYFLAHYEFSDKIV
jgi:uncharacterized membrane protein YedE/YeeE